MDKVGHLTTSYFVGVLGIKTYQWAGFSRKQSIWIGGLTGTFFQSAVEILDGFSEKWGASSGDLVANSLGSLLAIFKIKLNLKKIYKNYENVLEDAPVKKLKH